MALCTVAISGQESLAPYYATPNTVVDRMLKLSELEIPGPVMDKLLIHNAKRLLEIE